MRWQAKTSSGWKQRKHLGVAARQCLSDRERMTQFSLRVYLRRRPTENVGQLCKQIPLNARGPREAEFEAKQHLKELDWKTQFAALLADDEAQYLRFWLNDQM
jgi:hypothetical protein